MNRRNFILGLGTAATLSGAASVTSAAIQDGAQGGADFRVVAAEALDVRRNAAIESSSGAHVDNTLPGYINNSNTKFTNSTEGNINFSDGSPAFETGGPNLTIDNQANGNLNASLVTLNDNSTADNRNTSLGGNLLYSSTTRSGNTASGNPPFEVENLGASSQDIGISYTYGGDAGGNPGEVDISTINQLFTFVDPNGNVISPTGTDGSHNSNFLTVSSGQVKNVGLILNYSNAIETEIANALGSGFGGAATDADLLDTVEFGIKA